MGVYINDTPSLIGTLLAFAWGGAGLFCIVIWFLGCAQEEYVEKEYDKKHPPSEYRRRQEKDENIKEIFAFIVFVPLMFLVSVAMGPIALFPSVGDNYHKKAWELIKRKRLDYYALISLPVICLATLWWM